MALEQLLLSIRLNRREEVSFLQMLFPVSKDLRVFNYSIKVWNTHTIQQRRQTIWILWVVLHALCAAYLSTQFQYNPFSYCSTQLSVCIAGRSVLRGTAKEEQTTQTHDKMRNFALCNSLNRYSTKPPSGIWGWEELIGKGFVLTVNFIQNEGVKQKSSSDFLKT